MQFILFYLMPCCAGKPLHSYYQL